MLYESIHMRAPVQGNIKVHSLNTGCWTLEMLSGRVTCVTIVSHRPVLTVPQSHVSGAKIQLKILLLL